MPKDLNEKWTGVTATSDPATLPQAADDILTGISEDATGTTPYAIAVSKLLANDKGGEAKTLYSVESLGAGLVSISADGQTIFYDSNNAFDHLAAGETATDTFEYAIQLANGALSTAIVTMTITGTNDAPTLAAGLLGATEDGAAVTLDLASLGGDVDGDDDGSTLVYTVTGAPAEGSASISGTTLSFDPGTAFQDLAEGTTRDVVVQVTATDAHGAMAVNDVTVRVTGSNDTPTLAAGLLGATEDGAAVTLDLATLGDDVDGDDDGSTLVYTVTGAPAEGSASITGTTLSFDPGTAFQDLAEGATRDVVVQVTADDGNGGTVTNGVTVTVTGTNDAPTLAAGLLDATEDGAAVTLDLASLGGDVDGDDDGSTLVYTVTGAPAEGSASITGTTLSFDPGTAFQDLAEGATRDVVVQVTADDGNGGTVTNGVTVTVTGTNDAPTLAAGLLGATEDGAAVTLDLATLGGDVDGDDDGSTLVYTVTGAPAEGSASITGTTLSFDPGTAFQDLAEGATRDVVVQVTATDAHGAMAVNDVTVRVTGSNDTPTLAAGLLDATEDGAAVTLDLASLGGDIDGDDDGSTLVYTVTGAPAEGSASISGTTLSFDPGTAFQDLAEGATRDVVVQVTATDAHGAMAVNDVTVRVTGSNDTPTLAAGLLGATEDGAAVTLDLATLGDDIDGDDDGSTLVYTVTGAPAEGSASITGTTLSFDPGTAFQDLAEGATRDVVVQVTADDGNGGTVTNGVTVTVTGTNDAPTLAAGLLGATEDGAAVTLDLATLGDDIDGDDDGSTLVYTVTGAPAEGSASITGTTLSFDPGTAFQDLAEGATRDVVVQVTADDGNGGTVTNGVTVTVTGTNDAPLPVAVVAVGDEDTTIFGKATAFDADADDLTFSLKTGSTNGAVVMDADGTFAYTPNADYNGADSFTYTVFDGHESKTETVTLSINPVADDPITKSDFFPAYTQFQTQTGQNFFFTYSVPTTTFDGVLNVRVKADLNTYTSGGKNGSSEYEAFDVRIDGLHLGRVTRFDADSAYQDPSNGNIWTVSEAFDLSAVLGTTTMDAITNDGYLVVQVDLTSESHLLQNGQFASVALSVDYEVWA